jgi:Mg2+-importing ATPase
MTDRTPDTAFWAETAEDLFRALGSGPGGLPADDVDRRRAETGPNSVGDERAGGAVRLLARQFQSPLVLILVFGAAVSFAVKDFVDGGIILAIILGSALLGFYQEYRASAAVAQLKQRLALKCRVLRGGAETLIPVGEVVPGDVVLLSAGNLVPADGIVLSANDCLVGEAALTGESFPVEKRPGVLPAETPVVRRSNMVFLGSSVRSGSASVLTVRTGRATAFGDIAARLQDTPPETAFAHGARRFGILLLRVMMGMVLFVLIVNQLLGRPFIESLLFAVALAVGLSPELLPAIMSVTLSAGAREMARRGVIVRHLESIENIGGMDVLCTDMTGTLTAGVVELDDAVGPDGAASDEVRTLAFLNASLESGIRNPLDEAIVADGTRRGLSAGGRAKVGEVPYDFLRKRLTVTVTGDGGGLLMITKGAFEHVLDICGAVREADGDVPLTRERRARLDALYEDRSAEGFRVLAVARRSLPTGAAHGREQERDMCLAGLLLFYDPPKPGVEQTIARLAERGIAVKVISGDNRHVSAHLARSLGLDPAAMLTGAELDAMKEEALWQRAPLTTLFVDVDPQQKERIVRALQRTGHTVGFLGDGINDAPALHAADVGITVEGAVDVARESADLVLLEKDLDVLCRGVDEGRRTFANTLKYISITVSANFGNMVSMALATPLLPFLPLTATQILLNNFLSDLPAIAISSDSVDPEATRQAQRWRVRDVRQFMIVYGLISSAFDLPTFGLLLYVFHAPEPEFQTSWFMISLLTELAVVMVLRTRRPFWRSRPSRALLWTTVAVTAAGLAMPLLSPVLAAFGFVPLSWALMGVSVAVVGAYVATTEAVKLWLAAGTLRAGTA